MENWKLIFTTRSLPQASIIKGMLEENNIPVMLENKQDSVYVMFGDIKLYVPTHLEDVAKDLMDQGLVN